MPFLRLETATPTETEKTIAELRKQLNERNEEIEELKASVNKIQKLTEFLNELEPEHAADFIRYRLEHRQSVLEVPEPALEMPITGRFEKKMQDLMDEKKAKNEHKICVSEMLELSRQATLEDEAEAKHQKRKAEREKTQAVK
jgi:hypothetical protein